MKQFMYDGKLRTLHRFIYEMEFGEVPDGMVVDHRCHNEDRDCPGGKCPHRRCCNPAHLEAVTHKTNVNRSHSHKANRKKCPQGHPYDAENTRMGGNGGRYCKTCIRDVYPRRSK